LAASGFYLSPSVKENLTNIQVVDEDDLFHGRQQILIEIPTKELRKVFGAWINRLLDLNRGGWRPYIFIDKFYIELFALGQLFEAGTKIIDHIIFLVVVGFMFTIITEEMR
jgi:hypothetical protein